ncbi:MAG: 2-oxoacid:acceptor oxidoreductase family protein [Candidatus Methanofastidiosia archaeon]
MREIRFHGRGGQGVVTASQLLAETALFENKYIQAFPEFGPERMGAPIRAFSRISEERIDLHSQVYKPDVVVVIDPTLLSEKIAEGLSRDGILVANTPLSPKKVRELTNFKGKIFTVDATKIAREEIGKPIANTACLGALVRATNIVELENLISKLKEKLGGKFSSKIVEGNARAIERAFEEVRA